MVSCPFPICLVSALLPPSFDDRPSLGDRPMVYHECTYVQIVPQASLARCYSAYAPTPSAASGARDWILGFDPHAAFLPPIYAAFLLHLNGSFPAEVVTTDVALRCCGPSQSLP